MQRTGKIQKDALSKCEKEGLYVECAYILLIK
jgi:hypothetical protein